MLKRVIISQRVDIIKEYGERRDALDQKWHDFCNAAGLTAICAPNDPKALEMLLKSVDFEGILLTGGNSPACCGGEAPERDYTDNRLIELADKNNLPLIGICRGCQSIVLYYGGTLMPVKNHIRVSHFADGIMNREVNSFHGFSAEVIPSVLEEVSKSDDGCIEAVRHRSKPIMGIMHHPERTKPFHQCDIEMFKKYFEVNE